MKKTVLFGFLAVLLSMGVFSQPIDSTAFFAEIPLVEMKLTTDIRSLQNQKGQDQFQPGKVTMLFPDSTLVSEPVQVGARGKFRRGFCRIPPIMLQFRTEDGKSRLQNFGKLKLVIACGTKKEDEELLLKEYLVYRLYNLIEDKSFRVRLLRTTYEDTRGKMSPFTQYAFLIEDDADMARRNGCKKIEHGSFLTDATNRSLITKVAIFQYLISNTDWSVPNNHNIKLIFDKDDPSKAPYPVPYDFDYCGLVNAAYAVPHEIIGTEKVTQRVYRGFPRNMDEIQLTLDVFRAKKAAMLDLVNNFELLSARTRKQMTSYMEEFFRFIEDKSQVKYVFIDNARTQ